MGCAMGVGRFVYTPILPFMVEALHLSASQAGLIASANFLGYLIGALLAAMPTLPGSQRFWLLCALTASSLTTGAMGLFGTMPTFLILRFVGGAASAFVLIIASSVVLERLAAAGRSSLSALHFAGVGSGIAVSAALVAAMLMLGHDWRSLWLASGSVSLMALLSVAILPDRGATPAPVSARGGEVAGDASLRRLILAYGLFGFGYIITTTFLVTIVRITPAIRGLEPIIWIVFGLAAAPSVALWAWIARRFSISTAFALACVIEAAGVLASVAWQTASGTLAAAILVGGTFMGITALGLIRARALATAEPRRALALMTGAFGFGQIVGPAFAGALSDSLGSFTVPSVVAAVALFVAAALARN
jgi:predicted MFS family arabinose efflux permease